MIKRIFFWLLATSVLTSAAGAAEGDRAFLVHAKTALSIDDAQICAVPNVAWTALTKGYEVAILFDASGVTAIKKGGWFGGDRTPLDKAALPERERKSLAAQLNTPLEKVPRNYGEYIRFLKGKGVKLYANKTMMMLYKIGPEAIDRAVTPLELGDMVTLFEHADVYAAY